MANRAHTAENVKTQASGVKRTVGKCKKQAAGAIRAQTAEKCKKQVTGVNRAQTVGKCKK